MDLLTLADAINAAVQDLRDGKGDPLADLESIAADLRALATR